jgi:DNA repair exonuclease SbcCD ATPase subunit
VRIASVHLPGFGRLSDFSRELSPGLNIFFGDNEVGKSTLQQAVGALLYGFFDGDRARAEETARHERFRPWSGSVYRGSLDYVLDDGRPFQVRRDFSSPDVITQVIDSVLGIDISPQFGRARHGNVPFARKHLGMSKAVFQSCAFISQGDVFEMQKAASPSEIGDAIAGLADSARRDVSAARAMDLLNTALNHVGSDRARTAKLPVARDRCAQAGKELEAADQIRRDLAGKAARLEELLRYHRGLSERSQTLRYLLHRSQASLLAKRLTDIRHATERARAASGELVRLQPQSVSFTPGLRDQVLALVGGLERSRESLSRLSQQRDERAPAVSHADRVEYEALRTSSGQLTEDQLRSVETIAFRDPPRRGLLAAIGRLFRTLLRALPKFIPGQRGREVTGRASPPISQTEARELLQRHQRFLMLRPLIEGLVSIERQLKAEGDALSDSEARIMAAIRSAGVEGKTVDNAFQEFESAWLDHEVRLAVTSAFEDSRRELDLLLQGSSEDQIAVRLAEHEDAIARLVESQTGLSEVSSNQSPETVERDLHRTVDDEHRTEVEVNTLGEEVRLTLERHRPRAELEEEVAFWGREVQRLQKARDALTMARSTIEDAMTQVYRDFAPAVNSFLSEGMEFVTEGRYHRVHVDPSTFKVSILVPETDQIVTDPPVSHGTRTLIYVLMRIGLAQHMSAIGESIPLVLDDPFVDLDSTRLPLVLDFLLRLSERMQILLFTKDEQVLRWFTGVNAGEPCRVHEMNALLPSRL